MLKKKVLSVLLTVLVTVLFITSTTTSASAVETVDISMTRPIACVDLTSTGEPGTVTPMAGGPILQSPGPIICMSDYIPINEVGLITMYIPANTTLNKIYLYGVPSNGYTTTAFVTGIGGTDYEARVNGNWYRVSNTNLGISGGSSGKSIAVVVSLSDSTHTYNILLVGCE